MSENPNFISNKFSKERNEEDIRWCRKIFQRGSVFASSRFVIRVRSDEKKKRKKELFKSRTTLVQRERERERGKKITQHKAEKWISSKARSFKFLFFFFFLQENSRFAYFRSQRRMYQTGLRSMKSQRSFFPRRKWIFALR